MAAPHSTTAIAMSRLRPRQSRTDHTALSGLPAIGCFVAALLVTSEVNSLAVAADPEYRSTYAPPACPNEIVDVYLSSLKRTEGPPIQVFLKPGSPTAHLRLPRQGLRVDLEPSIWAPLADCGQKTFAGYHAVHYRTTDLAGGLDVPYGHPRLQDHRYEFYALDPDEQPPSGQALPSVRDADDRDGMARKGSWVVEPTVREVVSGKFCLNPPAQAGLCYAYVAKGLSYRTNHVIMYGQAFMSATLGSPPDWLWTQITAADIESYFAFMRRIADLVVVAP